MSLKELNAELAILGWKARYGNTGFQCRNVATGCRKYFNYRNYDAEKVFLRLSELEDRVVPLIFYH